MFNPMFVHHIKDKPLKLTKQEINKVSHLDYERFEFLGDMIIKFFVGIYLCIFLHIFYVLFLLLILG